MDTDDLTRMAYYCIIDAEEAADVLRPELGAACSKYKTEEAYLLGILNFVKAIEKHPRTYLDDWNLLEDIDIKAFKVKIQNVREQIEKTIKTPYEDRGKR
jgi:hypothetical protein